MNQNENILEIDEKIEKFEKKKDEKIRILQDEENELIKQFDMLTNKNRDRHNSQKHKRCYKIFNNR